VIRQSSLIIVFLTFVACSSFEKESHAPQSKTIPYGMVLVQISCPTFIDWLESRNIESTNNERNAIARMEASLNCEGPQSYNRQTTAQLVSLPVGNYFLNQSKTSHLFNLTYEEDRAFSFKVYPNTITYIGDITIQVIPSVETPNDLELKINVVNKLGMQIREARRTAPDYSEDFPIKTMLWRPVFNSPKIKQIPGPTEIPKTKLIDTSPNSFF